MGTPDRPNYPHPTVPARAATRPPEIDLIARALFPPGAIKLWPVRLFSNSTIYDRVGGLYDPALGFWSREVRRQAAGATPDSLRLRHLGEHATANGALKAWAEDGLQLETTRPRKADKLRVKIEPLTQLTEGG